MSCSNNEDSSDISILGSSNSLTGCGEPLSLNECINFTTQGGVTFVDPNSDLAWELAKTADNVWVVPLVGNQGLVADIFYFKKKASIVQMYRINENEPVQLMLDLLGKFQLLLDTQVAFDIVGVGCDQGSGTELSTRTPCEQVTVTYSQPWGWYKSTPYGDQLEEVFYVTSTVTYEICDWTLIGGNTILNDYIPGGGGAGSNQAEYQRKLSDCRESATSGYEDAVMSNDFEAIFERCGCVAALNSVKIEPSSLGCHDCKSLYTGTDVNAFLDNLVIPCEPDFDISAFASEHLPPCGEDGASSQMEMIETLVQELMERGIDFFGATGLFGSYYASSTAAETGVSLHELGDFSSEELCDKIKLQDCRKTYAASQQGSGGVTEENLSVKLDQLRTQYEGSTFINPCTGEEKTFEDFEKEACEEGGYSLSSVEYYMGNDDFIVVDEQSFGNCSQVLAGMNVLVSQDGSTDCQVLSNLAGTNNVRWNIIFDEDKSEVGNANGTSVLGRTRPVFFDDPENQIDYHVVNSYVNPDLCDSSCYKILSVLIHEGIHAEIIREALDIYNVDYDLGNVTFVRLLQTLAGQKYQGQMNQHWIMGNYFANEYSVAMWNALGQVGDSLDYVYLAYEGLGLETAYAMGDTSIIGPTELGQLREEFQQKFDQYELENISCN